MNKWSYVFFIFVTSLVGCNKEYFQWDLEKVERLATVSTVNSFNISNTGATINSLVEHDGGLIVNPRGVCWSTNQNPTIMDKSTDNGRGTGAYTSYLTFLDENTTYYVRAYAQNSLGIAYGNQINFTTTLSSSLPTVIIVGVSNVNNYSAVFTNNVTSEGSSTVTQRGVCWSTNQNPTIMDNITFDGSGTGAYTSSLTGLNANTLYFVRAYATNQWGTAYSDQDTFRTPTTSATLVGQMDCWSLNGITSLYNGMNGTTASWGTYSVSPSRSGACWGAPDPNNSGQLGSVVGSNHYVQFNSNFSDEGYIEFWVNTYNPGYNNLIPVISINGATIGNVTMIGGQSSSFNWMKVRSPNIQAGNNTIRISFDGSYYVLKVDDIDFYEF